MADVSRELGWLTAVMVSVELTDQLLQPGYLHPEVIKLRQGWSVGCRPEGGSLMVVAATVTGLLSAGVRDGRTSSCDTTDFEAFVVSCPIVQLPTAALA